MPGFVGVGVLPITERRAPESRRREHDRAVVIGRGHRRVSNVEAKVDLNRRFLFNALGLRRLGIEDASENSQQHYICAINGTAAGANPETSLNFEIGTKWNLFDDRLLATAALFQSTKYDVMEGANYTAFGTFNTGENKVEGVELGVTGMLTDDLTVSGGVTFMNAEVLKSATPANVGKTLGNFAKSAANILAKYRITEQATVGGAFKYESRRFGGQPDTAAPFNATAGTYSQPVPSYSVVDLFASYQVNDNLAARLNVNNVGDVNYYTAAYRGGFFLYKGDGRSVKVTLDYAL